MAKKFAFAKGLATGVVATAATVAGAIFAVKKKSLSLKKKRLLSFKKIVKKQPANVFLINF